MSTNLTIQVVGEARKYHPKDNQNAKLQYEAGQTTYAMSALTDSGDKTTFRGNASFWSRATGHTPVVRPDGLITGGAVIPAVSGTDDLVDVAALTAYIQGALQTVSAATDESIARPATNVSKINSITVTSGGAIAVVPGTDGFTTAFSETRAAAGGPPLIPVTSVEIKQVRLTSSASAPIDASEIFGVIGTHCERTDYPLYDIDYGDGINNACVTFVAALPNIHTGMLPKNVYASYADPMFDDVMASDFVGYFPLETTNECRHLPASPKRRENEQMAIGGRFTAFLKRGKPNCLMSLNNQTLWLRFYQDKYNLRQKILCQGDFQITQVHPHGNLTEARCSIGYTAFGKVV